MFTELRTVGGAGGGIILSNGVTTGAQSGRRRGLGGKEG